MSNIVLNRFGCIHDCGYSGTSNWKVLNFLEEDGWLWVVNALASEVRLTNGLIPYTNLKP